MTKIKLTPALGPRSIHSPIYAGKKIPLSTFTPLDHQPLALNIADTKLLSNISNIISPELTDRQIKKLKDEFLSNPLSIENIDTTSYIRQINEQIQKDENLSLIKPAEVKNPDPDNPLLTNRTTIKFASTFINQITNEDISHYKHAERRRIYEAAKLTKTPKIKTPFGTRSGGKHAAHPIIQKARVISYLYHIYSPNKPYFLKPAYRELESIMLLLMEKILISLPEFMGDRTRQIEYSDIIAAEKKLKVTHLKG